MGGNSWEKDLREGQARKTERHPPFSYKPPEPLFADPSPVRRGTGENLEGLLGALLFAPATRLAAPCPRVPPLIHPHAMSEGQNRSNISLRDVEPHPPHPTPFLPSKVSAFQRTDLLGCGERISPLIAPRGSRPCSAGVSGARGTPGVSSGKRERSPLPQGGRFGPGGRAGGFPPVADPGGTAEGVRREASPPPESALGTRRCSRAVPLPAPRHHGQLLAPFTAKRSSGGAQETAGRGYPACKERRRA